MKVFLAVLTAITVILCIFTGGVVFYHFFPDQSLIIQNEIRYDYIEPVKNEEFHEIYDKVYVTDDLDEEVEKEYVEYIEEVMSDLPLYNYDYSIILTAEELYTDAPYAQGLPIAGTTNAKEKTIRIKYHRLEDTLLHEIGHAVDRTYNYSQTEEFLAIYNLVEHNGYYTITPREYFAYCYDRFLRGEWDNTEVYKYFSLLCYGYCLTIG